MLAICGALFVVGGEWRLPLLVGALVAGPFVALHGQARRPRWARDLGFPATPPTHHQRAKIFVVVLVNVVLFAVGLPTYHGALERYGSQVFALSMQRYGPGGEGSRNHMAVVLFTNHDLGGRPWPVPYAKHQQVLDAIRRAKPRAVMIDFLFVEPRPDPTLGGLADALEAYGADRIPVFLAESVHPGEEVRTPLRDRARPVAVPRFVDDERRNLYPFFRCVQATADRAHCVEWHPTAATALYADLCRAGGPDACRRAPLDVDAHREEELLLVWGRKVLVDPWTTAAFECNPSARFSELDCPFTPTVSVTQLLNEPLEAGKRLRDRVVFYGAYVTAGYDLIQPPVQQPLPGVYAHAMALDNLLTYGAHYKREAPTVLAFPHLTLAHLVHALIVMTVPILFLFPTLDWLRGRRSPALVVAAGAVCAACSTLYVLAIAVFEYAYLDVVPEPWIASLIEVAVGAFAVEFLTPSLEKLSAAAHEGSQSHHG